MKKLTLVAVTLVLTCLFFHQFILAEDQSDKEDMMIREAFAGTWLLESRELPDGTILKPPQIAGMMIFSKGYACATAIDSIDGKTLHAYSVAMTYGISDSTLRGKWILNSDITQGSEGKYDTQPTEYEVKLSVEDGKISFKPFAWSEMTIEGDTWTQTANRFKDTYKKVE